MSVHIQITNFLIASHDTASIHGLGEISRDEIELVIMDCTVTVPMCHNREEVHMAEEIRDLIEKINQEGILAAEEKAKNIEDAAKQKADDILNRAKLQAEDMITDAK